MNSIKKLNVFVILLAVLATACACGTRTRNTAKTEYDEPQRYTYRVVAEYPHSREAYTQGLHFADGLLWEGTGEYGRSVLKTTDLKTGREKIHHRLPDSEFGEGVTLLGDTIYQLTWTENTCHLYDRESLRPIGHFRYVGEGWGLATDGEVLYFSNGTPTIYRLDPKNFNRKASIVVTLRGEAIHYINELEWIDGKLWANVYLTDEVLIIDPKTGIVEGVVDLAGILPDAEREPATDVLNGIAYDEASKRIFITGKKWPKIYQIELIKQ